MLEVSKLEIGTVHGQGEDVATALLVHLLKATAAVEVGYEVARVDGHAARPGGAKVSAGRWRDSGRSDDVGGSSNGRACRAGRAVAPRDGGGHGGEIGRAPLDALQEVARRHGRDGRANKI